MELMADEMKMTDEAGAIENPSDQTSEFDFDQVLAAIEALQDYGNRQLSKGSNGTTTKLFTDDRFVYFDVVMKKYPRHLPPVKFIESVLPHPFHEPQTATSCIIVGDLDKHPLKLQDRERASRIYKEFFEEEHDFTEYSKVISVSQLKTEYKTFEDRRKLCHAYDIFIADKRLRGDVTRWLGQEFIQNKKVPFLMDVTKNVKRNFRRIFSLTRAVLTPSTLKFTIKIGRLNQPAEHLLSNLKVIKRSVAAKMPGTWLNVRSAYLSLPGCLDLPVYVDWGSSNLIKFPKTEKTGTDYLNDEFTIDDVYADDD